MEESMKITHLTTMFSNCGKLRSTISKDQYHIILTFYESDKQKYTHLFDKETTILENVYLYAEDYINGTDRSETLKWVQ
jgi:hypothetical protein